jgi:CDP-diacylglycerol---glycerol-3-phosphate 3-phosphatidyltransferase
VKLIPGPVERGYLQVVAPVARFCIARGVSPNLITLMGAACWAAGGVLYGAGFISAGGWFLGITALFDAIDGQVARALGRNSPFGAFFDSTLDRIADGCVLGGLAFFYATSAVHYNPFMVATCAACLMGTFLVSYTRARAEAVGINLKVGMMQRPERVILLSAPQAFFGLAWDGIVLGAILLFLTVTAWLTVVERMFAVYRATRVELSHGEVLAEHPAAATPMRVSLQPQNTEAN